MGVDVARGTWTSKAEFILSLVGYAVGLGNIWRFPYLAYKNGGGAFLIPYIIMLAIAGMPLFFFELCFGQFSSLGPVTIWKVVPLFKGIGFGMASVSAMVCIYYNVIIMYSVYYMAVSFVSLDTAVPWSSCDNTWNTDKCVKNRLDFSNMTNSEKLIELRDWGCMGQADNGTKFNLTTINSTNFDVSQITGLAACTVRTIMPAEEYWNNVMLRIGESDGIGNLGPVSLKNVLMLLITWVIVYFCLRGGVKTSGKVVYFTATFPYLMLFILLIRGVTLPGFYKGILYYITPQWDRLLDIKVWADAATQIFYSLGAAFGSLITMASYNKFNNNCYRDAIAVALINCGTSVFGGFVIFSMLGYMSEMTNVPVQDVATQGAGLIFIAYPEGLSRMPVAPLWNFLFFFMIFTLGLDSQFAMMEAVISSISDEFPRFLRKRKALLTFVCCLVCFLLGIACVSTGGIYVLTLMDNYSGSYGLMLLCLFELIAVNWIYGYKNFCKDIQMMLGFEPGYYWQATWVVITPVTIMFILIMSAVGQSRATYGAYVFEDWAQGLGWMMVGIPIMFVIGIGLYQLFLNRNCLRNVCRPTYDWGPALDEDRIDRYEPLNTPNIGTKSLPYNEDMDADCLPPIYVDIVDTTKL